MSIAGARTRAHHQPVLRSDENSHKAGHKQRSRGKRKAKETKYADGVGDAHYLVPEPDVRCRATVSGENWSYWFFIGHGQKRCAPREEALLSLGRTTRSRFQSRGDTATAESRESSVRRGRSASQTRQTVDRAATRYASSQRAMNHIPWQTLPADE